MPPEQEVPRHAVAPGQRGDGLARRQTLLDDAQLLMGGPAAASSDAGDHVAPAEIVVGHEHVLKHRLEPSMVTPGCPAETGDS